MTPCNALRGVEAFRILTNRRDSDVDVCFVAPSLGECIRRLLAVVDLNGIQRGYFDNKQDGEEGKSGRLPSPQGIVHQLQALVSATSLKPVCICHRRRQS
jgi:hypothetical protein